MKDARSKEGRNMKARKLIVTGMGAGLLAGLLIAAPAARAQSDICGFWDVGSGSGSAMSAKPGSTPAGGNPVLQETKGAWSVCFHPTQGQLYLTSAAHWCFAPNSSNKVVLRACDLTKVNQQWTQIVRNGVTKFENDATNSLLCASGGVGTQDVVTNSGSSYHCHWKVETSP